MNAILQEMGHVEEAIRSMAGKTFVFWGAGRRLGPFLRTYCIARKLLPMPDFICESTRDLPEASIEGVPVIKMEDLRKRNSADTVIVITAGLLELQAQVVHNELYYYPLYHCRSFEAYWFLKENFPDYLRVLQLLHDEHSRRAYTSVFRNLLNGSLWCQSLFEPSPYFGNDLVGRLDDSELLVLAGAFNGKHIDRALANNSRVHVCAFEPNGVWHDYLVEKYRSMPSVEIHNKVLWDGNERLMFDGDELHGGLDAHVCSAGNDSDDAVVEGVDLDSFLTGKPTLIALDVEGSEERVLAGAMKTIGRNRPKLTICLYHRLEDYVRLPLLISEIAVDPPYTFHFKHHSCITAIESVLYAL